MIEYRKIQRGDVQQISQLHLNLLNSRFSNAPGKKLLEMYYEGICYEQGAVGYVAEVDKLIAGYICGVWDMKRLQKNIVIKKYIKLIYWGLRQVFQKRFLQNVKNSFSQPSSEPEFSGYELRPIVVSPLYQGQGIAKGLLDKLIIDAQSRDYSEIFLKTEVSNLKAQRFYEKHDFKKININSGYIIYIREV